MNLSPQAARKMVSAFGWAMIKQGKVWPSLDGQWEVYQCGTHYTKRKINPLW